MALSEEQKRRREGKVTAGFLPYLMAGKEERIAQEWMRLVGHEALVEPDFDSMWNLLYGSVIEPIALDWHERKTGHALTRRGEVVNHPRLPHVCCTLDAWRADDKFVVDCKAWSSWQKIDYICTFLVPQIVVQRACTDGAGGALLIVHGGAEPEEYPLQWGGDYERELWDRVDWFWQCVLDLTAPVQIAPAAPTIPVIATKTQDMTSSNSWAEHAATWLQCWQPAKDFKKSDEELKTLINDDTQKAWGHGIVALRNKKGSVTIRKDDMQ